MWHAACALVVTVAFGQANQPNPNTPAWPDDKPFTHVVQNLGRDIRALASMTSVVLLAAGGGATAAVRSADDNLAQWAEEKGPVSYTTAGHAIGDGWTQGSAAVATYAIGRLAHMPRVTHIGSDLVRVQALNAIITTGLKVTVDRRRPTGGRHAFPSGHTSATFASATVLYRHFGWKAGVPAYAVASFVGWTRVRAREHWVSDIAFGATLGLVSGFAVTTGHRQRDWKVVPTKTDGGAAVYFVKNR